MDARARQVDTLRANAALKASTKRAAAEAALQHLRERGEPISFAAVARTAKVSRTYLYKCSDLAAQIRSLIAGDTQNAGTRPRHAPTLSARLRLRAPQQALDALHTRIRDLEAQLAASQNELGKLRSEHERCAHARRDAQPPKAQAPDNHLPADPEA